MLLCLRYDAKLHHMDGRRLIGSKQAAALLGLNRGYFNRLASTGRAPGLVRKDDGGPGGRGRYLFDADEIERIARERIAKLHATRVELEAALDETRAAS
jgi:hypothetical protein